MNLRPNDAWDKSARLIKLCLGYTEGQQHRLRKIKTEFNDDSQRHVITLTLEVKHNPLIKGIGATLYEGDADEDGMSLIRMINDMVDG